MVKIKSSLGTMTGKLDNLRLYERGGITIGSIYPSDAKNPRTEAQMKQRIKINNILDMYKCMKECLQTNFEGIIGNRNAASLFRSYNLLQPPVWLTQSQKNHQECVLAPYVVSHGHLATIGCEYLDETFVSNINVKDLQLSDITVGDFVYYVRQYNDDWFHYDDLQIILLCQKIPDTVNSKLYVPAFWSFPFDMSNDNSRALLSDALVCKTFNSSFRLRPCNIDGHLGIKVPEGTTSEFIYAFALVHGRGEGVKRMVSIQQLCLSNTTLYDYYTGTEAMDAALASYKTNRNRAFLDPGYHK